jgi:hypothetical protein
MEMTFDVRGQDSNSHTACSKGHNPPNPEHSASIHHHPKMMCGLQERLSRIKGQLVSDSAKGILAMEEVIASLHNSGHEPFPGFTENMTAEFAGIREELEELDPNQLSNAQRFVAIAKRINFLSRTFLFVAGYSLSLPEIRS